MTAFTKGELTMIADTGIVRPGDAKDLARFALALLDELEAAEKRIADHDRQCDEQYLLGMRAGWNFGTLEDGAGFDAAYNARRKLIDAAGIITRVEE